MYAHTLPSKLFCSLAIHGHFGTTKPEAFYQLTLGHSQIQHCWESQQDYVAEVSLLQSTYPTQSRSRL